MPRLFKHSYCPFQVLFLYEQVELQERHEPLPLKNQRVPLLSHSAIRAPLLFLVARFPGDIRWKVHFAFASERQSRLLSVPSEECVHLGPVGKRHTSVARLTASASLYVFPCSFGPESVESSRAIEKFVVYYCTPLTCLRILPEQVG